MYTQPPACAMDDLELGAQMLGKGQAPYSVKRAKGAPKKKSKRPGTVHLTKEEVVRVWNLRECKIGPEEVAMIVGGNVNKQRNIKETIHRI